MLYLILLVISILLSFLGIIFNDSLFNVLEDNRKSFLIFWSVTAFITFILIFLGALFANFKTTATTTEEVSKLAPDFKVEKMVMRKEGNNKATIYIKENDESLTKFPSYNYINIKPTESDKVTVKYVTTETKKATATHLDFSNHWTLMSRDYKGKGKLHTKITEIQVPVTMADGEYKAIDNIEQ